MEAKQIKNNAGNIKGHDAGADPVGQLLGKMASTRNWFHTAYEPGGPYLAWRGTGDPDEIARGALNKYRNEKLHEGPNAPVK